MISFVPLRLFNCFCITLTDTDRFSLWSIRAWSSTNCFANASNRESGGGLIKGWWVVFFILSFFQLSLHLSSLVRTQNFWQMLQPRGTEGREEGPCLFNLQRENVCVITGSDDSPCFRQRASRPWRPPLTHEYLARQLTVIGHCCEPSGLVCAHRRHVRQHTTVASHPRWF